jgi:hypothetical protein
VVEKSKENEMMEKKILLVAGALVLVSCGQSAKQEQKHDVVPPEFREKLDLRIKIKELKIGQQAFVNLGVCIDLDYHVRLDESYSAWPEEEKLGKNIERREDGYYYLLRPEQKLRPEQDCDFSTFAKIKLYDDWAEHPSVVCPTTCVVRRGLNWTSPVKQSDLEPPNIYCLAGKNGEGDGRIIAVDPNDQGTVIIALEDGCSYDSGSWSAASSNSGAWSANPATQPH